MRKMHFAVFTPMIVALLLILLAFFVEGAAAQADCDPSRDIHATVAVDMDGQTYIALLNTSSCELPAGIASYDSTGAQRGETWQTIPPGLMIMLSLPTEYRVHAFWGQDAPGHLRFEADDNFITPDEFTLTLELEFPPNNKVKYG